MELSREISNKKRIEQADFYGQISMADLSINEIVKHLAKSEEEAEAYEIQGQFYGEAYPEIKKIIKSSMKTLSEREIVDLFYYTLKKNDFFKFKEKHFHLFLNSVEKLFPNFLMNDYYKCQVPKIKLYILLGLDDVASIKSLRENSFEDFELFLKFIHKAQSFSNFPNMRKKDKSFDVFLTNENLLERVRNSVRFFNEFDFVSAGALTLLLKDSDLKSKAMLFEFHESTLKRRIVWLLGSFYKDFNENSENKKLLKDLEEKYPQDWIEEYSHSSD